MKSEKSESASLIESSNTKIEELTQELKESVQQFETEKSKNLELEERASQISKHVKTMEESLSTMQESTNGLSSIKDTEIKKLKNQIIFDKQIEEIQRSIITFIQESYSSLQDYSIELLKIKLPTG